MMSLSDDKRTDVIGAFNTKSRYLDDILNIINVYFDKVVIQIVIPLRAPTPNITGKKLMGT